MWFKHRAWIPVAWILAIGNAGAVWFAARTGEAWHAIIHALLAAGFAFAARHLRARQQVHMLNGQIQQVLDLNEQQQQTIDGMEARLRELEERVDFTERLLATQRDSDRLRAPPP